MDIIVRTTDETVSAADIRIAMEGAGYFIRSVQIEVL